MRSPEKANYTVHDAVCINNLPRCLKHFQWQVVSICHCYDVWSLKRKAPAITSHPGRGACQHQIMWRPHSYRKFCIGLKKAQTFIVTFGFGGNSPRVSELTWSSVLISVIICIPWVSGRRRAGSHMLSLHPGLERARDRHQTNRSIMCNLSISISGWWWCLRIRDWRRSIWVFRKFCEWMEQMYTILT